MGSFMPTLSKEMRVLILTSLVAASLASPYKVDVALPEPVKDSHSDHVNELLDAVESGLNSDAEGRALFISITLTSTNTVTSTATATVTTAPLCFTATTAIPDCATLAPNGRDLDAKEEDMAIEGDNADHDEHTVAKQRHSYNPYPNAIVTRSDGKQGSILDILPTPVMMEEPENGRIDFDAFDGVYQMHSGLQSGNLEWREVAVQGLSSCGRSANKRPRILALSSTSTDSTFVSTSTSTVSLATVTNTVQVLCTNAGFTFAVPAC